MSKELNKKYKLMHKNHTRSSSPSNPFLKWEKNPGIFFLFYIKYDQTQPFLLLWPINRSHFLIKKLFLIAPSCIERWWRTSNSEERYSVSNQSLLYEEQKSKRGLVNSDEHIQVQWHTPKFKALIDASIMDPVFSHFLSHESKTPK